MSVNKPENAIPARPVSKALEVTIESRFLNSVRHNELESVRQMLCGSSPPDINIVDDRGGNALVIAIENGHLGKCAFQVH